MDDDVVHPPRTRVDKGKAPMGRCQEIQLVPLEISLADLSPRSSSSNSSAGQSEACCSRGEGFSQSRRERISESLSLSWESTSGRDDLSEFSFDFNELVIDGYQGDLAELDVEAQRAAWEAATRPKMEKIVEEEWPFEFVVTGVKKFFKMKMGPQMEKKLRKLKEDSGRLYSDKIMPGLSAWRKTSRRGAAGAAAYQPKSAGLRQGRPSA